MYHTTVIISLKVLQSCCSHSLSIFILLLYIRSILQLVYMVKCSMYMNISTKRAQTKEYAK